MTDDGLPGLIRYNSGRLVDCHVTEEVRPVYSPPSATGEVSLRGYAPYRMWWRDSDNVLAAALPLQMESSRQ